MALILGLTRNDRVTGTAAANCASPGWDATIVHVPRAIVLIAPPGDTVHTLFVDEVYITGNFELAVAARTKIRLERVTVGRARKVMTFPPVKTENVRVTGVAAAKLGVAA